MKCTFCGKMVERGTGKTYAMKTGKLLYFCSKKCEHNLLILGRIPRKTRWTADYQKVGAKK